MKNNQRGFSIVEVAIVIIILAVLAGVGWVAWQHFKPEPTKQASTTATQKVAASTDCSGAGDFSQADAQFISPQEWKAISTHQVDLPAMGVSLTVPDTFVNQALCRPTSSGGDAYKTYAFSLKSMLSSTACEEYYAQKELTAAYTEL